MNKNYFLELAEYNIWANQTVSGWLEQISEEQWTMPLVSSFNSV
ncbi:DinB family protein, partial [Pseudoalteromonas piscicida]